MCGESNAVFLRRAGGHLRLGQVQLLLRQRGRQQQLREQPHHLLHILLQALEACTGARGLLRSMQP